MTFDERLMYWLLGAAIGFVAGYIVRSLREIKEELHVDDHHPRPSRDNRGALRMPTPKQVLTAIFMLMVLYAAVRAEQALNAVQNRVDRDLVTRCQSGTDYRDVDRKITDAIYNLATGFAAQPEEKMSSDEIARYNRYVQEVNEFRDDLYDQIKPSEQCAPYVEDNDIEPPTKPFPEIPVKE